MSTDFFFGYGSLVNAGTHDFAPLHPARAEGWRRAWVATSARPVAYLSAMRDPHSEIDGVIAPVPKGGWAALDAREAAYERRDALAQIRHEAPAVGSLVIYEVDAKNRQKPGAKTPVLLSYLDVVIQGYLTLFGAAGAAHFFDTTSGWEAPILDDRAAPRYPRALRLTQSEQAVVDAGLDRLGCQRV